MCRWPLRTPSHYTLFFGQLKTPSWSHVLIWFNFNRKSSHFFLIPTCYNFLAHKVSKLYDLNVVTTLKMQPHYSRSSRENAIPFSGTSPLPITRKYSPPSRRAQLLSVSGYNIAVLFTFPHQILCMGRRSSFFYFMRIFLSSTLSQRFLSDTRTKCRGLHFMA